MNFMSVLKREKRTIIIFLIEISIPLFIFVGIPLGIYIITTLRNSSIVIQEAYWGIVLPAKKEMEEVLSEHSEIGPHGEGLYHSIYVVERNEIKLRLRIDTKSDIENTCLEYCEDAGTADEYMPDFSQEYRWRKFEKYQDTLILVYFVATKELHIFEDFF
ncbi:MAG: hypothetical protein K2K21_18795 [Lachnospiraceae bacterium]|nr:hypothetical protein [Lachnospiraceae bacterium]